jgi:hypothetical protein
VTPTNTPWTWESGYYEFVAQWSQVTTICVPPEHDNPEESATYKLVAKATGVVGELDGLGYMHYDSGVCDQQTKTKTWVSPDCVLWQPASTVLPRVLISMYHRQLYLRMHLHQHTTPSVLVLTTCVCCCCGSCCVLFCVQFTGIAAQDFKMSSFTFTDRRKWERLPKSQYESYAWSRFHLAQLPDDESTSLSVQVGTDSLQQRSVCITSSSTNDGTTRMYTMPLAAGSPNTVLANAVACYITDGSRTISPEGKGSCLLMSSLDD